MEYDELMKSFSAKLGNGIELTPDASGTVALQVDDMTLLILNMSEIRSVILSSSVGELPPQENMDKLYKAILNANYNFVGTSGATLSINPDNSEITLCKVVNIQSTDEDAFYAEVEKFINVLETWRKIVQNFRGGEVGAENAQGGSEGGNDDVRADYASSFNGFMQV